MESEESVPFVCKLNIQLEEQNSNITSLTSLPRFAYLVVETIVHEANKPQKSMEKVGR